jgi:hypothetical protein
MNRASSVLPLRISENTILAPFGGWIKAKIKIIDPPGDRAEISIVNINTILSKKFIKIGYTILKSGRFIM